MRLLLRDPLNLKESAADVGGGGGGGGGGRGGGGDGDDDGGGGGGGDDENVTKEVVPYMRTRLCEGNEGQGQGQSGGSEVARQIRPIFDPDRDPEQCRSV